MNNNEIENVDFVVCPICGHQGKRITLHCKKLHNKTKEDMKNEYPSSSLMCLKTLERNKEDVKKAHAAAVIKDLTETKEKERLYNLDPKLCIQCKRAIPYETQVNNFCGHSCSATYNNLGKGTRTEELREKISISLTNFYSENPGNRYNSSNNFTKIKYIQCRICNKPFTVEAWKNKSVCSQPCKDALFVQLGNNLTERNGNKSMWKEVKYDSQYYGMLSLDSTWEPKLLESLENNNIVWLKPKHFKWIDETGKIRRYFPDAYLPDYGVYLDPKNPYLYKEDKFKLAYVVKNYGINLIVITDKNLCTWEHVKILIETQTFFNY
jgi:hypothetical protein